MKYFFMVGEIIQEKLSNCICLSLAYDQCCAKRIDDCMSSRPFFKGKGSNGFCDVPFVPVSTITSR